MDEQYVRRLVTTEIQIRKTPFQNAKFRSESSCWTEKDVDSLGPSRNIGITGEHRTDAFSKAWLSLYSIKESVLYLVR
jgi:hypothetical protein